MRPNQQFVDSLTIKSTYIYAGLGQTVNVRGSSTVTTQTLAPSNATASIMWVKCQLTNLSSTYAGIKVPVSWVSGGLGAPTHTGNAEINVADPLVIGNNVKFGFTPLVSSGSGWTHSQSGGYIYCYSSNKSGLTAGNTYWFGFQIWKDTAIFNMNYYGYTSSGYTASGAGNNCILGPSIPDGREWAGTVDVYDYNV